MHIARTLLPPSQELPSVLDIIVPLLGTAGIVLMIGYAALCDRI